MVWLLEVIMLLEGPTKSKIRICTWLKSCCGFCIFTSSTLRVKLMPTTADLSGISCRVAQVEFLPSILIIQVGKFRTKIMGHLILPFWQENWSLHVTLTVLKYFAFGFQEPVKGSYFNTSKRKLILFLRKIQFYHHEKISLEHQQHHCFLQRNHENDFWTKM